MALWYIVCAGLLCGHTTWFIALRVLSAQERSLVLWTGCIALEALIVCLALLLATTPPDAIRLPRTRSNLIILTGTVLLQIGAALIGARQPTIQDMIIGLATIVMTATLHRIWETRNQSAWIAAVFAWNPIAVLITLG